MGLTQYFNFLLILTFFTFGTLELSQAQTSVSITNYGAVADGVTDNLPAINRAIAAAGAGGTVNIPAGKFAYRGVIRITGVKLVGAGPTSSILYALDYNNEAIFMYGSGSQVRNLQLTGVKSPSRLAAWETTRITLFGATNFLIDNIYIEGGAAAGIQTANGANNGRITNNKIRNTLADSIHLTDGAGYITVENNFIEYSGDDGVAIVSYQGDGSPVHNITARNNRVLNNKWGRNMSVLGGRNILYENNYLDGNPQYACLYIVQEAAPWYTMGVYNVTAQYNTIKNCGNTTTGHPAVLIYTDDVDYIDTVKVVRNDIYQPSYLWAFRMWGSKTRNILLDSNRINGTSNEYDISSPGVTMVKYSSGSVGYVEPSTAPAPESASGTLVPPASQIVDSNGRVFTLVSSATEGNKIAINGVIDPVTNQVELLLYYNKLVYQKNSPGDWYRLDGSSWTRVSDPRVSTPTPDTQAPSVAITSPSSGATFKTRSVITVNATASDNVGVIDVKFYLNGTLICTDSTSAYSCSMRLPKRRRTNTIEAVGRDAAGNIHRKSIIVYTR